MISWRVLINQFHEELLQRRILEEVDADSLEYSLLELSSPSSAHSAVSYLVGGAAALSALIASSVYYYQGSALSYRLSASLLGTVGGISLLTAGYCQLTVRRLVAALEESAQAARTLHTVLRQRDTVTFGLGMQPSLAQQRHRLRAFLALRRMVRIYDEAARSIVREYGLNDELEHLLSQMYSAQMTSLLEDDVDEESQNVTERGISTLLDLLSLHRSEVSRLLVLSMISSSASLRLRRRFLSLATLLSSRLSSLSTECRALCLSSSSRTMDANGSGTTRSGTTTSPACSDSTSPLLMVAAALEDVAQGIVSGQLDATATQSVLRRVLCMGAFPKMDSRLNKGKEDEQGMRVARECEFGRGDGEAERRPVRMVAAPAPPVDQVFETIKTREEMSEDVQQSSDYDVGFPSCDRSLLGELRGALDGRAREFEQRERRALAAFYGVSEQEMLDREREEREEQLRKELEKKQMEKSELECVGEGGVDGTPLWTAPVRPSIPVEADLLRAIAARRNQTDTVLGDEDSD